MTAALLALLMCLGMVACGPSTEQPPVGGDASDGNEASGGNDTELPDEVLDRYNVVDSLPAKGEINYQRQFNIFCCRPQNVSTYWVGEETGATVDDAMFAAIANTEERFGVSIVAYTSGLGDIEHGIMVRSEIMSGEPGFDINCGGQTPNISLEGLCLNLHEISEFDYSKPWWNNGTVENLTIMGQLYLLSNAMSYAGLKNATCTAFNQELINDWGLTSPYELVENDEWTLDTLITQTEAIYEEQDGVDDKSDGDVFGLLIDETLYCMESGFGIYGVLRNEDGDLYVNDFSDGKMYDLVEKLYYICYDANGGYMAPRATVRSMFSAGLSVYIMTNLSDVGDIYSATTVDYGIVPRPKLDSEQENYVADYGEEYFIIPNTCEDLSYVGTILESMAAEGYRTVRPVYFDKVLKNRYSKDAQSKAMMDIIQDSQVVNLSIYGAEKWFDRTIRAVVFGNHSKDFASYYETQRVLASEQLDFVLAQFESMKENAE